MIEDLLQRQNRDGGWSYRLGGSSWTEPTCFSILALLAKGVAADEAAMRRAVAWLSARQNADGGWSPREGVPESTWVTTLIVLLPPGLSSASGGAGLDVTRAEAWVRSQTGRESGFWYQLRMRLLGVAADPAQAFDGWPWYPGTAAWVAPTSLSILALEKLQRRANPSPDVGPRLQQGRQYLLARRCRDGGWNHGSTRALGYDSDSYPETTGMALLALHGVERAQLANDLASARRHLLNCESLEAASWLTLALSTYGEDPPVPRQVAHGGTNEIALAMIAEEAIKGRNVFVE